MAAASVPGDVDELRIMISARIGLDPADIGDGESLFELGLDSVTALSLIASWRRAGLPRPVAEFIDAPTLADWWRLISDR